MKRALVALAGLVATAACITFSFVGAQCDERNPCPGSLVCQLGVCAATATGDGGCPVRVTPSVGAGCHLVDLFDGGLSIANASSLVSLQQECGMLRVRVKGGTSHDLDDGNVDAVRLELPATTTARTVKVWSHVPAFLPAVNAAETQLVAVYFRSASSRSEWVVAMHYADGLNIGESLYWFVSGSGRMQGHRAAIQPTDPYTISLARNGDAGGGYLAEFTTSLGAGLWLDAGLANPQQYAGVAVGNCCEAQSPPADVFIDAIVECP